MFIHKLRNEVIKNESVKILEGFLIGGAVTVRVGIFVVNEADKKVFDHSGNAVFSENIFKIHNGVKNTEVD